MTPLPNRPKPRAIGLAAGSLWLIAIGGGFVAWSLFAIGPATDHAPFAWLACLAACLIAGTFILRKSLRLPAETTPPQKELGKRFLIVVGIEVAAFAIVNPIAAVTGHFAMLAALNLIVIGVHFIPLAKLFGVPRYYWMGFLFCAISIATLVAIPKDQMIGHALAWLVIPSGGCGLVATLIGTAGLLESLYISDEAMRESAQ
jgi:hypothetical protein